MAEDEYLTIEDSGEALFKDRGSKFLGFALPVRSEPEIKKELVGLREIHPKAVHHCFAWRLGPDRHVCRASDDGEPSGSAGKPILNTIYSFNVSDVLVVVVRYFGGTLLGVPGLINAYKTAAEEALGATTTVSRFVTEAYRLTFPYERMNEVMRIVKDADLQVSGQSFEMTCTLTVSLRTSLAPAILDRFSKIRDLQLTDAG